MKQWILNRSQFSKTLLKNLHNMYKLAKKIHTTVVLTVLQMVYLFPLIPCISTVEKKD